MPSDHPLWLGRRVTVGLEQFSAVLTGTSQRSQWVSCFSTVFDFGGCGMLNFSFLILSILPPRGHVKPAVSSHHSPLKVSFLREITPLGEQDSEPQETDFTPDLGHLGGEFSTPRSPTWNPFGKVSGLFPAPPTLPSLSSAVFRGKRVQLCVLLPRCLLFLSEPGSLVFSEFRVCYSVTKILISVSQYFQDSWRKQ